MFQPIQFDWQECRHGTREAILTAIRRFGSGEKTLSINMPTRYGKTHTGRLISAVSTRGWITPDGQRIAPFATVNVWVTVNVMLRDQAAGEAHWLKFDKTFRPSQVLRYGAIKAGYDSLSKFVRNARPNDEDFLAVTIQQLLENLDIYVLWTESLAANGLGVIFHFDETHLLNEEKPWGKIVKTITDAGGRIAGYTATPRRADGGLIPGFHATFIGDETRDIEVLKEIIRQEDKRFGLFERQVRHTDDYVLTADVDIPFTAAWNQGYLLKASWLTVDVDLSEFDMENHEKLRNTMLSNLMPSTCAKYGLIGKCVRQTKTIRDAVELAYQQLMLWRMISPRAALVGYTVADRFGGRNEHANQVKREFLRLNPALKILIVAQNVEESAALLEQFEESDYDIVLAKGMAGLGWDCERIQVVLDLGDARSAAALIQRWMRGGTPYMNHTAFSLIVLADQMNAGVFQECCENLGGAASVTVKEIINEELRELEDRKRNAWVVDGACRGNFADSDKNQATADLAPLANALMHLVKEFRGLSTDAALALKAQNLGLQAAPPPGRSIDEMIDAEQTTISSTLDRATNVLFAKNYGPYNTQNPKHRSTFGDASRFLYRRMYEQAGLSYDADWVELRKNRDLAQLMLLSSHAQLIESWVNQLV